MSNAPVVRILDVSLSLRAGFWLSPASVLTDLSLDVRQGAVFGLLGPNGAGKTSLIQLITGLRRPSRGSVRVGGDHADTPQARARVGYLPERPYFHDHLTGRQLLRYLGRLSRVPAACGGGRAFEAKIDAVLELVGLAGPAAARELRHYSKGMLQRVGIAQAVLHDPEVLVLDEPMSGLDPEGRRAMRELLRRLSAEGKTVFFSSHIIPDVEAICDEVALLSGGRLVENGTIGQLLSRGPLRTEVAFQGVEPEKLREKLGARARGQDWVNHLEPIPAGGARALLPGQEAVNEALEALLALKARVLWVQPVRPTLEEYFHEAISKKPRR